MAHKRRMEVEKKQEAPEAREPEGMSWRDWLLRRYAPYWYWVGVLFLDIIIFLEMMREGNAPMVAAAVTIVAAIVQIVIYLRVWGRGGLLSDKSDDEER